MNTKTNWLKRMVLTIIVVILSSVLVLFSYVFGHEKGLMNYQASLSKLPEVESVIRISEYGGMESYYVAQVVLINGSEQYYFIKDNVVEYHVPVEDLLTGEQAASYAMSNVGSGIVKHYYLGIKDETPIYEVMISSDKGEHYVIIDAKTGKLVSHFIID